MLGGEDFAFLEDEAVRMYVEAGLDPSMPASPAALCKALYKTTPQRRPDLPRESLMAIVDGRIEIYVRSNVRTARARWLAFHEMAHPRLRTICGEDRRVESSCNFLGACCAVPRPALLAKIEEFGGHKIRDLAHAFGTTQALVLLRIGEVVGRPVKVTGLREIVRGRTIEWPETRLALAGKVRKVCHPIKLDDENKLGLMAVG